MIEPVETPWGKTSSHLVEGIASTVEVIVISRHGKGHKISPTNVNYRANIYALKERGCSHLLSATACGILRAEGIKPGDLVLLDSFIDMTKHRQSTFYDGEVLTGVSHIPMGEPFCKETRQIAKKVAQTNGVELTDGGTMVTIEGPRFSTRAESKWFQSIGGDVVNMTTVPEAPLANEAGLCFLSIACATDYDAWKDDAEAVNVAEVVAMIKKNTEKAYKLWRALIPAIKEHATESNMESAQDAAKFAIIGQD